MILPILCPVGQISGGFGKRAVEVNYAHAVGVNFNMHVVFESVRRKD